MDEKQLTEIASRLGSDAAERLDVDGVARRVVAELRSSPARVTWWSRTPVLRAAAVVAMLVSGGVIVNRLGNDLPGLAAPVGLEDFSVTELAEVLDSLDQITPVDQLAPASLDDLDETQLQELLAAMEG